MRAPVVYEDLLFGPFCYFGPFQRRSFFQPCPVALLGAGCCCDGHVCMRGKKGDELERRKRG